MSDCCDLCHAREKILMLETEIERLRNLVRSSGDDYLALEHCNATLENRLRDATDEERTRCLNICYGEAWRWFGFHPGAGTASRIATRIICPDTEDEA